MHNLKKNITYQTLYQILVTITPLITAPYLARKLGVESIGIYSFTQSIVNYFILFAMLGFINYGTRTIALCNNENEEICAFNEIYSLQIICSSIALVLYILFSAFYNYNTTYMLLQSFWVLSCMFDVTWYFFGKEEYKITVIRNTVIKIISILLILLLIKEPSDIWKYILIMSGSVFVSQLSLWIILKKKIDIKILNIKHSLKKHIKPVIIIFIPLLAMSIYQILDKTMLGILSTNTQSGLYYNSDKIVNIPLGILNGLGTVMLSKISVLQKGKNSKEQISKVINNSIIGIMCASVAFCFGISAIANDFVPCFFGNGYEDCILLIRIFSIILLFKAMSNILRTQYMLPFKKEKILTYCVLLGAVVNIISNYIFIKIMGLGALGATLGTLIAEAIVCTTEFIVVNKDINILKSSLSIFKYIILGTIMYKIVSYVSLINVNIIVKICLEILIGGLFYVVLCLVYFKATNSELLLFISNKYNKKDLRIKNE